MTREEARQILATWLVSSKGAKGQRGYIEGWFDEEDAEAFHMAIEALSEPKTIIGIDIPYGSDKGIATFFKGKDDKLILEEVKEIMAVVRCKDCKHYSVEGDVTRFGYCNGVHEHDTDPNGYCHHGERR